MTRLVERAQVLQHRVLASYVAMIQADLLKEELEFVESETEKEEIIALYDAVDYQQPDIANAIKEEVFYHIEDDLSLYPTLLGNALYHFFIQEEIERFYIIPYTKSGIISTIDSNYAPFHLAQQSLQEMIGSRSDNKAYEVDTVSAKNIVQSLFWISRCDGSIPKIFLQPDSRNYFINICKYGNLHLYVCNEDEAVVSNTLLNVGLRKWVGQEYDRFSNSTTIEGRFTIP